MVFYFVNEAVSPPITYFVGKDKYENEELIKYGWPEDVWFHVDNLSSAHVYIRLNRGQTLDNIPQQVIEDACQLVKANSMQGNKMNNIDVVYTMWSNLKKLPSMEVGQVTFFDDKQVRKMKIEKRKNEVINRLDKTKIEKYPDLKMEREERDRKEREHSKLLIKKQRELEKEEEKRKKEEADLRNYSSIMKSENMTSNVDGYDSDDFW